MQKVFLTFVILLTCSLSVMSARDDKGPKVVCGPYVQCVTEDSFTVIWVTDMDAICWIETAPDDGTHFYHCNRTKHFDMRGQGVQPIGKIHKIKVEGLEKGSSCRYRLMSKGVVSFKDCGDVKYTKVTGSDVYRGKPYQVKTFQSEYDTLRFDIYNDIHGRDSLLGVLMDGARNNLDFVMFNGDMTTHIESHDMVQTMYLSTAATKLGGSIPLFASRGNHELRGRDAVKWFDYFATPTGQTYYSFRIGKYFFIVLDGCEDKPDDDIEYAGTVISEPYLKAQEEWLKGVLASEEFLSTEVRIVFCHIPPETKGWHGNMNVCKYFVPHLNKADIDVMFSAHIHKWRLDAPDSGKSNANFPVVCCPNVQRTEVTASADKIVLNVINSDGVKTQSLELSCE